MQTNTAKGKNVQETPQETALSFFERCENVASELTEQGVACSKRTWKQTSSLIRKYPTPAILAGVGIGAAAGMLLTRRRV